MQTVRSIIRRDPEGHPALPRGQIYLLVALAIVVVLALALAGFTLARPGVLPGTTLDGLPLGGLDREALIEAVASYAERTDNETIAVEAVTGVGAVRRLDSARKDLGLAVDRAATVELVWRRGRQLNPVLALADHVRALAGGVEIRGENTRDGSAFERWVTLAVAELDSAPIEAALEITGATVSFTDAEVGHLLSVVEDGGRPRLHVDPTALQAVVDAEQRAALESDPVDARIRLSSGAVVIDPAQQGFRFDAAAAAAQLIPNPPVPLRNLVPRTQKGTMGLPGSRVAACCGREPPCHDRPRPPGAIQAG